MGRDSEIFLPPCPSLAAFPPAALPRRDLGMARLAEHHQVPLGMGAAFRQRPDMVYFLGGRHLPRLPAFLALVFIIRRNFRVKYLIFGLNA